MKETLCHQTLVGPAFQNVHFVVIWRQWLTDHSVYPLIQSRVLITELGFNHTMPPVRLVRTWAHRGSAGLHYWVAGSGPVLPLLYLPASVLQYLAGMVEKWELAARSSTSVYGRNLSFFTRDEAFYETKWVSPKWSATKAPWLICLLGYCSCHLWKTSGQQTD